MKKLTSIVGLTSILLAGCATQSHTVAQTDPAGNKTVTTDKSSQSDNAALNVVGEVVKITGDIATAVIPPIIPVIVSGLTKPVTTPPASSSAK